MVSNRGLKDVGISILGMVSFFELFQDIKNSIREYLVNFLIWGMLNPSLKFKKSKVGPQSFGHHHFRLNGHIKTSGQKLTLEMMATVKVF